MNCAQKDVAKSLEPPTKMNRMIFLGRRIDLYLAIKETRYIFETKGFQELQFSVRFTSVLKVVVKRN